MQSKRLWMKSENVKTKKNEWTSAERIDNIWYM